MSIDVTENFKMDGRKVFWTRAIYELEYQRSSYFHETMKIGTNENK